ncbi:hypothetical protein FJR48_07310 [Sulfurimonas lithotrophica]|uniref:Lipoprotein n=1 Tax=Sulfurimonas lithotrophica TaxID=2590022 RepID=A0A5P8P1P4_9BACT|nr:hypothetical protein [Sulfurimonas lithotrophica]QFR49550.1 hypothetical protein FJR48_07310 [Sulfurimonas lithotrophica]
MKKLTAVIVIAITLLLSGCSSKVLGEPKARYKPTYVDKIPESELAYLKLANGVGIWSVDGKRIVSAARLMFGNGDDSVKIKEGPHNFRLRYKKTDFTLGTAHYEKGHEYFLDYVANSSSISFWVKDMTTNKVILGKEIKDEED